MIRARRLSFWKLLCEIPGVLLALMVLVFVGWMPWGPIAWVIVMTFVLK